MIIIFIIIILALFISVALNCIQYDKIKNLRQQGDVYETRLTIKNGIIKELEKQNDHLRKYPINRNPHE